MTLRKNSPHRKKEPPIVKLNHLIKNSWEIEGDDIFTKFLSAIKRRHFLRLLAIVAAGAHFECGN